MSEIKPALSAEEWAYRLASEEDGGYLPIREPDRSSEYFGPAHEVAASALYGQPFGFTREELAALQFHVWCGAGSPGPGDRLTSYGCDCSDEQRALVESAIAKIAALLPPEDK